MNKLNSVHAMTHRTACIARRGAQRGTRRLAAPLTSDIYARRCVLTIVTASRSASSAQSSRCFSRRNSSIVAGSSRSGCSTRRISPTGTKSAPRDRARSIKSAVTGRVHRRRSDRFGEHSRKAMLVHERLHSKIATSIARRLPGRDESLEPLGEIEDAVCDFLIERDKLNLEEHHQ